MITARDHYLMLAEVLRRLAFALSGRAKDVTCARKLYFALARARYAHISRPLALAALVPPPLIRLSTDARLFPQMENTPEVQRMLKLEDGDLAKMKTRVNASTGITPPGVLITPIHEALPAESMQVQLNGTTLFRRRPGSPIRQHFGGVGEGGYRLLLREVPSAIGRVVPGGWYCPDAAACRDLGLEGEIVADFAGKSEGVWLAPNDREAAQAAGLPLFDAYEYMVRHLEAVLQANLVLYFGYDDLVQLLNQWREDATDERRQLIDAVQFDHRALLRFWQVLQALVEERVPLTKPDALLQSFAQADEKHGDVGVLVEDVRIAIRLDLPGIKCRRPIQVPSNVEASLQAGVGERDGKRWLALAEQQAADLREQLRSTVAEAAPASIVLVVNDPVLRPFVRRLIAAEFPDLPVLAKPELLGEEAATKADVQP
jgi:type III secretory pathway component EscV